LYLGQDISEALQNGTFSLSVDVTGTPILDPLPPIPGGLEPSVPEILVAPITKPFPWWLLLGAILLLASAKKSR
jgi:hypothetical protein